MRAVVFAYHDVGVRCIQVLLARGVEILLVVTHENNPAETIWFDSVANLCEELGIACVAPDNPDDDDLKMRITALQPDVIFSFYYRHMLPVSVLSIAPEGAFNMHGSLLPKYRGRVPINWAVLHGETETGATLHWMTKKPDAGSIVGQTAVPILPDDTAAQVFVKVVVAAEQTLWRALPEMMNGRTPALPNDLTQGSYFGGRNAEDGRIDWSCPARVIYNLIRAVAPPYPGAWTLIGDKQYVIANARMANPAYSKLIAFHDATNDEAYSGSVKVARGLAVVDNRIVAIGGDGVALMVLELRCENEIVTSAMLKNALHTQ
jgi:methionyl-tRNA formyltransferase